MKNIPFFSLPYPCHTTNADDTILPDCTILSTCRGATRSYINFWNPFSRSSLAKHLSSFDWGISFKINPSVKGTAGMSRMPYRIAGTRYSDAPSSERHILALNDVPCHRGGPPTTPVPPTVLLLGAPVTLATRGNGPIGSARSATTMARPPLETCSTIAYRDLPAEIITERGNRGYCNPLARAAAVKSRTASVRPPRSPMGAHV